MLWSWLLKRLGFLKQTILSSHCCFVEVFPHPLYTQYLQHLSVFLYAIRFYVYDIYPVELCETRLLGS